MVGYIIFHNNDFVALWDCDKVFRLSKNTFLGNFSFNHGCTNCWNLEIEPKYLTKKDAQLNPDILRTKNDKWVL